MGGTQSFEMRFALLLLAVCYTSADVSHIDRKYLPPSRTSTFSTSSGYSTFAAVPSPPAAFAGTLGGSHKPLATSKPFAQQLRTAVLYTHKGFPTTATGYSGHYASAFPAESSIQTGRKSFSSTSFEQKVPKFYQAPAATFSATPAKLVTTTEGQYVASSDTQSSKPFESPQSTSTFGAFSSSSYNSASPSISTSAKYSAPTLLKPSSPYTSTSALETFDRSALPSGALKSFGTPQGTANFGKFSQTSAKYTAPSIYSASSAETFDKKTFPAATASLKSSATPQSAASFGTFSSASLKETPSISTAAKYTAPAVYKAPTFETSGQKTSSTYTSTSTLSSSLTETLGKGTFPAQSAALKSFEVPHSASTFESFGSQSVKSSSTAISSLPYSKPIISNVYSSPLVETFEKSTFSQNPRPSSNYELSQFNSQKPKPFGASSLLTSDKYIAPTTANSASARYPFVQSSQLKYKPGEGPKPYAASSVETFSPLGRNALSSKPLDGYRNSAPYTTGSSFGTKYASNGGYSY